MGDMKSLARARMELEELYMGIPDDSVNLTFQDLANVKENANASEKKKSEKIQEANRSPNNNQSSPPLNKLPSLDFKRGLQESNTHHHIDHAIYEGRNFESHRSPRHHHHHLHHDADLMNVSPGHHRYAYDDMSMNSTYQERGGRPRRPGIPHSNICTVCSTYIYIFRHRCLVCGRVYCRNCVSIGMGEMTEGRKCIQCLGKRFSHRYIGRAGKVGCCSRYPSTMKQAELRWAEKGPKRSGEKAYGHSTIVSISRSHTNPTRPHIINNASPSFVSSSSTHSPYSHHHLPL